MPKWKCHENIYHQFVHWPIFKKTLLKMANFSRHHQLRMWFTQLIETIEWSHLLVVVDVVNKMKICDPDAVSC